MPLAWFELIMMIFLVYIIITQIIIPAVFNRPFFPFFRMKNLEKKLKIENEMTDAIRIGKEIEEEKIRREKLTKEKVK